MGSILHRKSHAMFDIYPPLLPLRIANKASLILAALPSSIRTMQYPLSQTSDFSKAEGSGEQSSLLRTASPSFEVNILRKALSYSLRYPWINDLMGTNTGSVHE